MGCRLLLIPFLLAFFYHADSESIISHFSVQDVDQLNTYPETVLYRPKMPAVIPKLQFFECARQETCTHVIWYERNLENKSMSFPNVVKLLGETVVVWKKELYRLEEEKENLGKFLFKVLLCCLSLFRGGGT